MEDFAELLGMSKDGYRMVEVSGWPNLKRITQIAKLLEVDIEYFYKEESKSIESMAKIVADQARQINNFKESFTYDKDLDKFAKLRKINPNQFDMLLRVATMAVNDEAIRDKDDEKEQA